MNLPRGRSRVEAPSQHLKSRCKAQDPEIEQGVLPPSEIKLPAAPSLSEDASHIHVTDLGKHVFLPAGTAHPQLDGQDLTLKDHKE